MMDLYVYQWLGNESIFLFVCSVVLTLAVTWYVLSFSRIKKSSESLNNVSTNLVLPAFSNFLISSKEAHKTRSKT